MSDICKKQQTYSNFNSEEWKAKRPLADVQNLVIKRAEKGSCVVVCDRSDYFRETDKQLTDKNICKENKFYEKLIQDLTESSNKIFRSLKNAGFITYKELKYFSFNHKRACNLSRLYFLLKFVKGFLTCLVRQ